MKRMNLVVERSWSPIVEQADGVGSFFAFHPLIPGVNAHGETKDEAIQNWNEAFNLYATHLEQMDIPRPSHTHLKFKLNLGTEDEVAASDGVRVTIGEVALCP